MQNNIFDKEQYEGKIIGNKPISSEHKSAQEMDEMRQNTSRYNYLIKLEEARNWTDTYMETKTIPEFLTALKAGTILAGIAKANGYPIKIHKPPCHEYFEIENIANFLAYLKTIGLEDHFIFETVDLSEGKNIPKAIYCIHGLATLLKKKGIGKGITRTGKTEFTKEEEELVASDIENIRHNFDTDKFAELSSLDEEFNVSMESNNLSESINSLECNASTDLGDTNLNMADEQFDSVRELCRTLLWRSSFKNILYTGKVSVLALKRFLDLSGSTECLSEVKREIIERFRSNYTISREVESLHRTIKLLLINQNTLRKVPTQSYPKANDYGLFKKTVYLLINDYSLIGSILDTGYELPLNVLYGDNFVGDFHFSKFILNYNKSNPINAPEVVKKHFMSSRVFHSIVDSFSTNLVFDLNPISIHTAIYGENNHKNKTALLDEAIQDPNVREEIVKRCKSIKMFIQDRIHYFKNLDLPFYCYLFENQFDLFIEPAILLSNNYIVAELFKYIVNKKNLFGNVINSFEQERLYFYNCQYDKTTDFDFSDYSPLKDFLESAEFTFPKRYSTVEEINDHFIDFINYASPLTLETNCEQVNSIIMVLKENMSKMEGDMRRYVKQLSLVNKQPHEEENITEIVADLNKVRLSVEDASIEYPQGQDSDIKTTFTEPNKKPTKSVSKKPSLVDNEYMQQQFTINLDTQFIELDSLDAKALETMIDDVKDRIIALISVSGKNDFMEMLFSSYESDDSPFDLNSLKQSVIDDLEFLETKGITSKSNKYIEILELIAKDILKPENKEYCLNAETADILFQKGVALRKQVDGLYTYVTALFESMTENKSWFFNGQCEPYSKYGTYKYTLDILKPKVYENLNTENLDFKISSSSPLIFEIEIYCRFDLLAKRKLSFADLLKLKDESIQSYDFEGVMSLNTERTIALINDQYIKY